MGEPPYKGNRLEPPSLSMGDTPIERDPTHPSSVVLGPLIGLFTARPFDTPWGRWASGQ